MLQKGDQFPQFELENQDGELVSNETLKGSKAILYFYPRDNTPTCTTEACDFRDNIEDFNIFMWISLDKDIFIKVSPQNADTLIKYLFERYPY